MENESDYEKLKYGPLLYEDSEENFKKKKKISSRGNLLFLLSGILVIGGVLYYNPNPFESILAMVFITIGVLLTIWSMWYFLKTDYGRFQVYEKGIRLTNQSIPFLWFSDIKNIQEKTASSDIKRKYCRILRRDKR